MSLGQTKSLVQLGLGQDVKNYLVGASALVDEAGSLGPPKISWQAAGLDNGSPLIGGYRGGGEVGRSCVQRFAVFALISFIIDKAHGSPATGFVVIAATNTSVQRLVSS